MIKEHLDKNNLHHAYLIEGKKEEIIPDVLAFLKEIGVETKGNQDFNQISVDSFKIDDARNLKSQSIEKGLSANLPTGQAGKKVFIILVNNFLIEAQNTLLKMFEEPIDNTIFFLIVPDTAIILPTLLSRFYLIKIKSDGGDELRQAEEFLKMSLTDRISFVKEMTAKNKDEDDEENQEAVSIESVRSKAIKFLNALETVLHKKLIVDSGLTTIQVDYFYQISKAREYLSVPGSSAKSLMESVALVVPKF
jgi:DNA polymerase III delta prime subunit